MTSDHLVFLSIANLRSGDIDAHTTPTLYAWANSGALASLTPTFPALTSCVQASMWTGLPPDQHGVIANGFFHRDRSEVEFWMARNGIINGVQIWEEIPRRHPGFTSAVWHAQNIKDAAADFIITPAPIHKPDGTTELSCYAKPERLYDELVADLGHFPLQHYWGPQSGIQSTRWILQAAASLIARHAPNFHWIYVPHLDYAAQKFGPDSSQAKATLVELDRELAEFAASVAKASNREDVVYLVAGEYALTDVTTVVYPNRALREAGLLTVREDGAGEQLDLSGSAAFAMVDHQLAHVYINPDHPDAQSRAVEALSGVSGIASVSAGAERNEVGLNHERSGEIILIAEPDSWFAYYWWLDDTQAPPFARTVDIHRKPGYDPVELFFDPTTKSIPLDATLVRGSHGVPATSAQHQTALLCSAPSEVIQSGKSYRDTDMRDVVLRLLGVS